MHFASWHSICDDGPLIAVNVKSKSTEVSPRGYSLPSASESINYFFLTKLRLTSRNRGFIKTMPLHVGPHRTTQFTCAITSCMKGEAMRSRQSYYKPTCGARHVNPTKTAMKQLLQRSSARDENACRYINILEM